MYPVGQVSEPQPTLGAGTTASTQSMKETAVYVDRSSWVLFQLCFQKTTNAPGTAAYRQVSLAEETVVGATNLAALSWSCSSLSGALTLVPVLSET